jgi:hypothetical protein
VKLSLGKRQVVIAGGVVAVVLLGLVVARASQDDQAVPLDNPASAACSDFADGYPKARSGAARLALADKVSKSVAGTDNTIIADRVAAVGDKANEGNAAWKSAADDLTRACRDAGWS